MTNSYSHSSLVPGTFKANGSEWKVTKDGEFIILCDSPDTHAGPAQQWNKEIQEAAKKHIEDWKNK